MRYARNPPQACMHAVTSRTFERRTPLIPICLPSFSPYLLATFAADPWRLWFPLTVHVHVRQLHAPRVPQGRAEAAELHGRGEQLSSPALLPRKLRPLQTTPTSCKLNETAIIARVPPLSRPGHAGQLRSDAHRLAGQHRSDGRAAAAPRCCRRHHCVSSPPPPQLAADARCAHRASPRARPPHRQRLRVRAGGQLGHRAPLLRHQRHCLRL